MAKSLVIVTNQYKNVKSGVGTVANALIESLSREFNLLIICPAGEEKPETKGIKVRSVQPSRHDPTGHKWFTFSKRAAEVVQQLDSKKYRLVMFMDARESYHTKNSKIPTLGIIHDFSSSRFGKLSMEDIKKYPDWFPRYVYYKLMKFFEVAAYNRLNYRLTVSEYTKNELITHYRIKDDVHVILNGIEFDKLKKPQKIKEEYSVLFVGGNYYRKGLPETLQAVDRLAKKYPKIKCYVIGQDKNAKSLEGTSERAVFMGGQDYETTSGYFAKCQVFCMPSQFESFSMAYLEGLYANMHVVASKNSGTPEIQKYFPNLHIVDPSSVDEIAAAIEESFKAPAPKNSKYLDLISSERMGREYIDLINKIIDGKKV